MMICAKCKYRPKLEDYLCYCGAIATFMNVWGFRCDAHAFQREPNDAMITDRMTITFGRMKTKGDPEKQKAAILDCEVTHQRLTAKKNELAENRRRDGWKPLFWMEAHG